MFTITLLLNKMIANAYDVGSFFDDGQTKIPPNQAVVEFSCSLSYI